MKIYFLLYDIYNILKGILISKLKNFGTDNN